MTSTRLINRVRELLRDAAESVTDGEIEAMLQRARERVTLQRLEPVPSYAGSLIEYRLYLDPVGGYDDDAVLYDGSMATVTPSSADPMAGTWSFAANREPPLYVSGWRYDIYLAAALVLEALAAGAAGDYDVGVDGQTLRRSQRAEGYLRQAVVLRRMAQPRTVRLDRS